MRRLIPSLLLVLIVMVSACQKAEPPTKDLRLALDARAVLCAGFVNVAEHSDLGPRNGLNLHLQPQRDYDDIAQLILRQEADAAFVPTALAVSLLADNPDWLLHRDLGPTGQLLLIKRSEPKTAKDAIINFEEKAGRVALAWWTQKGDLPAEAYDPPPSIPIRQIIHKAQYSLFLEPLPTIAGEQIETVNALEQNLLLLVNCEYLKANSRLVDNLIRALIDSVITINARRDFYLPRLAMHLSTQEEWIEAAYERLPEMQLNQLPLPWPQEPSDKLKKRFAELSEAAKQARIIRPDFDPTTVY